MISNSDFTVDATIRLENVSIEDLNILRKTLLGNIEHCHKKNKTDKPTRRIVVLQKTLDALWNEICEARTIRAVLNSAIVKEDELFVGAELVTENDV